MKLEDIINDIIYQTIQATKYGNDEDLSNIHTWAYNRLTGYDTDGKFVGLPDPLPAQALMDLNSDNKEQTDERTL